MTAPKDKSTEIYHKRLHKILFDNFLGGIAWGLGVTIGAAIIIAFGGFILSQVNLIPVIGSFVAEVVKFVQQSNPNL